MLLPHNCQVVVDRFASAGQDDARIVAAFLGGSYARGMADAYSDIDLYLVTTADAYEAFCAELPAFVHQLGKPLFLENFGSPNAVFFILQDGTEGEIWVGRNNDFSHIHRGPFYVLLDKEGVLADSIFTGREATSLEQKENLRQFVYWFWHDLSHFITAMGRRQLWWAYGQLEVLRLVCVNLVRLSLDFSDTDVGDEGYFKLEKSVPTTQLTALEEACCPLEAGAMLRAARTLVRIFQELAPPLAKTQGITYPAELAQILNRRLANLTGEVRLRPVQTDDLPRFFEYQADPVANHMAAFTARDPADLEAFMTKWARILEDEAIQKQSVLYQGRLAGYMLSFEQSGQSEVSYWLDRSCWGQGVTTRALALFLGQLEQRPLYARAAKDNVASIRVLQKCGFVICGEDRGFANARGQEIPEFLLRLDAAGSAKSQ